MITREPGDIAVIGEVFPIALGRLNDHHPERQAFEPTVGHDKNMFCDVEQRFSRRQDFLVQRA